VWSNVVWVRLTAIEIPPAVTGGDPGLLKLGRICVMLGANDSGKSRILRSVSRALDSGYPKRAPASERPSFFVQLERSVAGWLDEEYSSPARSDLPFLKDRTLFGRALVGSASEQINRPDEGDVGWRGNWHRIHWERLLFLRRWAGLDDPEWDPLFECLAESRYAVIRPVSDGWSFDWCLPRWGNLDPRVQQCLATLDVFPESDRPIAATPLLPWVVGDRGLPRIRVIPHEDATLEIDVNIQAELEACPEQLPPDLWSPMVRQLFERMTKARLPPFITNAYDVTTDHRGVTRFVHRLAGTPLTATQVADGFRIWVEIALIDGSETLTDPLEQLTAILKDDADWPGSDGAAAMHVHLHRYENSFVDALTLDPSPTRRDGCDGRRPVLACRGPAAGPKRRRLIADQEQLGGVRWSSSCHETSSARAPIVTAIASAL
jgi:hypothetical protein